MTFRAVALGNDETAANDNSFTITVPGSVAAGDVLLVLAVENTGTATYTISGGGTGSSWSTRSGPDDNSNNQRTYLWSKTATADSAGATVTVTSSASGRFVGVLSAHYDVTEAGLLVGLATDTSADSNIPSATVPIPDATGWHLVGMGSMRRAFSSAALVSSVDAGHVLDGQSNTAFGDSPNLTAYAVHKTATVGAGAQGLGTIDPDSTVSDNLYTVGLAPASGVTTEGATATATGQAHAGEAFGSGATATVSASAHAGVAVAASQDETVVGAVATATADAHAGQAPALLISATPEPDATPPRVRIDITDTRGTPATSVTVLRINPDGRQLAVRTSDDGPFPLTLSGSNRVGTIYDYEAPFGERVTYTLEENTATVAPVTLDVDVPWLVHPGIPSRSVPLDIVSLSERVRQVVRGVFRPLGNRYPVVNTDGRRKAPEGSMRVATETDEQRRAMDDLLDDAGVLLLNVPAGLGMGMPTDYIAIDTSQEARLPTWGSDPRRVWDLPYMVVDRPSGGSQAQWNLDAVEAGYATLDDVKAAFPTLADLQANTPAA